MEPVALQAALVAVAADQSHHFPRGVPNASLPRASRLAGLAAFTFPKTPGRACRPGVSILHFTPLLSLED
jgi:hypothetical protein